MAWFDSDEIWNITIGHLNFLHKQIMNTPDKITYVTSRDVIYRYQQGLLY
jgi:hypothetical protein